MRGTGVIDRWKMWVSRVDRGIGIIRGHNIGDGEMLSRVSLALTVSPGGPDGDSHLRKATCDLADSYLIKSRDDAACRNCCLLDHQKFRLQSHHRCDMGEADNLPVVCIGRHELCGRISTSVPAVSHSSLGYCRLCFFCGDL